MPCPSQRIRSVGVALIVAAFLAACARTSGAPAGEKVTPQDLARVRDLQQLADAVAGYNTKAGHLPSVLDSVRAQSGDTAGYHDPVTGIPYEYSISDDTSFNLCATFDSSAPGQYEMDNWDHQSGHQCFHRIITPKNAR